MKLFLVGGTVRNHLLGVPRSKDLDFAVECDSFDEMLELLMDDYGLTPYITHPEFVTVRGRLAMSIDSFGGLLKPRAHECPSVTNMLMYDADFTLCRAETQYSDKRHPDTVTPTNIVVDLSRRDFTINAIAVSESGTVIDPYGGMIDAAKKLLRCVGSAEDRFMEDPLRMLRAIRFATLYDLRVEHDLQWCLGDRLNTDLLYTLPTERVREELTTAMRHDWRETMVHLMVNYPGLGYAIQKHHPGLWFKATEEKR